VHLEDHVARIDNSQQPVHRNTNNEGYSAIIETYICS
jgi:hypothetical protein